MRLTGRTTGKLEQQEEEGREKNGSLSYAIIKFDPSLRTAYCYKRDMLVGGFGGGGGADMRLYFKMKEWC